MDKPKLPQAKLREFLGKSITITGVVKGTSDYGPYVLLLTKTHAIISSGTVILKQADEIASNLPATFTVAEKEGKKHKYFVLE